mmetsp:Transcript_47183/g.78105  ORF Transcript_47183/g.78105 Transcript_47183/m.78105 type:complete len:141 (+) Transcript_47183:19-441(+)
MLRKSATHVWRGLTSCLLVRASALRMTRPTPSLPIQRTALIMPSIRMCTGSPAERTVVETCKEKISAMLEPTEIKVEGAFDDPNGSHISIYCVSEAFEGKRSMQRQQLVFKAIWDEMQGPIPPVHAVDSMVLKTPSEVNK